MSSTRPAARARRSREGRRVRLRRPGLLALLAALPLAVGLAYLVARQTSLFSVHTVSVAGAPADLQASVRGALARFEGQSLVSVDSAAVERAAEAIPAVRRARVDRDFPHTLRVTVTPERAVAIVRRDDGAWLVAGSGRVLQEVERGRLRGLPRVWLSREAPAPRPGSSLLPAQGALAVSVLARVPADFPAPIATARGPADALTLVLPGKTELRLGDDVDLGVKLAAAAAVLEHEGKDGMAHLAYLDLSLPARPVGAEKSQVDS